MASYTFLYAQNEVLTHQFNSEIKSGVETFIKPSTHGCLNPLMPCLHSRAAQALATTPPRCAAGTDASALAGTLISQTQKL